MTTEIRGLIPLVAIIPYFYLKKISKNQLKHLLISAGVVGVIYATYIFLPLLFNNPEPFNELVNAFIHGAGKRDVSANYLPLIDSIKVLGSYLFLTPFAMFLFIRIDLRSLSRMF